MKIELFIRAVCEPKKIETIRTTTLRFTYMRGGRNTEDGELKLGAFVEPVEIINHTNFYFFLIIVFGLAGGKNEDLPLKGIWL
jgi:hypothetical protein